MTPTPSHAEVSAVERMLRPRSVALVGVSGRAESLNARPLRYLREHGFTGSVHPVNPRYEELQGLRCVASLADVPGQVDLVLSMVPAAMTPDVVRQAGAIGAAGVVVFASGFGETGAEGAALQEEVVAAARETGVRVLGPNCQGIIHAPSGLSATFTAAADRGLLDTSRVAYVGQSGAVGGSILDLAVEMGLGLSIWVSTGNQADLTLVEAASAVLEDDAVRVLMVYTEVVPEGHSFRRLAARAHDLGKHLVVLVSGRSEAGRRAAASHTGSMLGDDVPFVLAAEELGVTFVDDVDEMLAVAAIVDRVGTIRGRNVAVITTSGGAGSLAADHCAARGLALPELDAATQQRLAPLVPSFGAVGNPVDVTAQLFNRAGSAQALGEVCSIVADDPDVDLVVVVLTMVTGELGADLARDLVASTDRLDKPLFVVWLASPGQTAAGRQIFRDAGLPVFDSVGDAARVAGLLAPHAPAVGSGGTTLDEAGEDQGAAEVLARGLAGAARPEEVLAALGVDHPSTVVVSTPEEAVRAAEQAGGPVAMKLQARGLDHKSDLGGVRLGVESLRAGDVLEELLKIGSDHGLDIDGVAVQQMIPPGVELIVGVTSGSEGYPPVVTVGIGGVTTELYRDVASALAPVSPQRAHQLMRTLRGWPLLAGYRGAAPCDVDAAAAAVAGISRAAAGLAGYAFEFEINPLIVAREDGGAHAVDLLASPAPRPHCPNSPDRYHHGTDRQEK